MEKSRVSIRAAVDGDVPTIVGFNLALCLETENLQLDAATVREGVCRFVAEPKRGRYYVAVAGGEVVGQLAHTYEWSDWRNGEIWWIQSVYVDPDFRSIGVFRALFEHLRELGQQDRDCCGIRLYMEKDNGTARQVYCKLGFREAGYEVFERLF